MSRNRRETASAAPQFDAIVVGSGMTGGWAAKELAEAGLKVLVVERGRNVEHGGPDYRDGAAPWDRPYLNNLPEAVEATDYPVQSQCYAFEASTRQFFVKDTDHPYVTPEGRNFNWIRGYHLGGRSVMWGRQTYRWSEQDFEENKKDGHGIDWPIRYGDLAPWYDHVESFAGISGGREGLPQVPDGNYQPPIAMNCVEKAFKTGVEAAFPRRKVIHARIAHLTEPTDEQTDLGRTNCQYRNYCHRGCSFGAYFSSLSSTLPAARRTGNLTVVTDAIVHSIVYDSATGRAAAVRVIDANARTGRTYTARMIFLCASALASAQILLNSRSRSFPRGLANSSGVLGRYLMDHVFGAGAEGEYPGYGDTYYAGRNPGGIYVPRYVNTTEGDNSFLRGYGYQGAAWRPGWSRGAKEPGIGVDLKRRLRKPGAWRMWLAAFGEMLPRERNHVRLHESKTDKWGIPLLVIDCVHGENEWLLLQRAAQDAAEMLKAAGFVKVTINKVLSEDGHIGHPPGHAIHEMGTARMGRDPKTSVLNGWNQAHDVPNLFVTDGACMASSACQNPSLTYMALTARAARHAVELIRSHQL